MAELYLTGKAPNGKRLIIAPITSKKIARCPDPQEDTSGYFLMEDQGDGPTAELTILARISDSESAYRLGLLLHMT